MDTASLSRNHLRMAKPAKPIARRKVREFKKLYIGQWIEVLRLKQVDVANKAGYTEAYLSELIAGRKKNPSGDVLSAIAFAMGLTIDDLYRPPPPRDAIEKVSGFSAGLIERLRRIDSSSQQ